MTNNEVLTLLVSGAALLVSGYSAIQYRLANENAKKLSLKLMRLIRLKRLL